MQANEEVLIRVVKEIFENLVFMPLDDPPAQPDGSAGKIRAAVKFSGAFSGRMILEIPSQVMIEVADNMLGMDGEEHCTAEQGMDALGELANVLCGNLLMQLAGPTPVFNLDPPLLTLRKEEDPPLTNETAQTLVRLGLNEGEVSLALDVA